MTNKHMKNTILINLLAMSVALGSAAQSLAATEEKTDRPGFENLDIDGNGELTKSEFDVHRAERFAKADTNGDGLLSRDEILARGKTRAEKTADRMFQRLDENRDGAISLAEMSQGRGNKFFDRADSDGSGGISEAEFAEMQERLKERRAKRKFNAE